MENPIVQSRDTAARNIHTGPGRSRLARRTCVLVASTLWTMAALGGPNGENIVSGQGSISRPDGATTIINQQSARLGIDWESFNVDVNEHVVFNQPGADALALNRIFDQNPSQIFGAIDANGNVLLMNPNGMVFGPSARLNIHSLVASSLDLALDDFEDGNYNLQALADQRGGIIVNHGLIQAATGGSVTLIGDSVVNTGLIVADYGSVSLAAGEKATLDFDGDGLMLFSVDDALTANTTGQDAAVTNSGTIQADAGSVLLTATTARDVFASVVNNEGVIRANRVENAGGVVRLVGSGGTVRHSGLIDATSTDGVGGNVQLLGDRVGLFDTAKVDASGHLGGGEVLIGGDVHGNNSRIANAERTYVGYDTEVRADAIQDGDGGKVVVWSDQSSRVYGQISARGGHEAGDGGFIETSGKIGLEIARTADVTARRGQGGEWLIDPSNLAIVADGDGDFNIDAGPNPFATTGDSATIEVGTIVGALDGGATVSLETSGPGGEAGDITLADGVILDFDNGGTGAGGTLTMNAANNIVIDGIIRDSVADADTLNLNLNANAAGVAPDDDTDLGNVIIGATGMIELAGGTFSATGIDFSNQGVVDTQGGSITITHQGNFSNTDPMAMGMLGILDGSSILIDAGQAGAGATFDLGGTYTTASTLVVNGGAGVDVFNLNSTGFAGTVNGAGGDDDFFFNVDTTATSTFNGDADNDDFTFAVAAVNIAVDGGANTDTIASSIATNTWSITATGVTLGSGMEITGAEVVNGGTGVDTFNIGGDFATLNGAGGNDIFNLTSADFTGTANGGDNDDRFNIDVNTTAASTLNGDANNDTFDFAQASPNVAVSGGTGSDTGDYADLATALVINLESAPPDLDVLIGNGAMGTLNSGTGNDAWVFNADGISGSVDPAGAVGIIQFSGFNTLDADAGSDTMSSTETANTWAISATGVTVAGGTELLNADIVSGGTGIDTFNIGGDFATLNGAGGNDIFNLTSVDFTGTANGGDNDDRFNIDVNTTAASTLNGDANNDTFDFAVATPNVAVSGGGGSDTGDYADLVSALVINLESAAPDLDVLIGNGAMGTLNSGTGNDAWVFNADGISGSVDPAGAVGIIQFSGFNTLDADAGSDTMSSTETANTWATSATGVTVAGGTALLNVEIVNGGTGIDTFNAGGGNATLNGEGDNDVFNLVIGTYTGTANGGADNDRFVINRNNAMTLNGDGGDDLFDFGVATSNVVIDGGSESDTANYADVTGGLLVNLDTATTLEALVGNGNAAATLNSGSGNEAWVFDAGGDSGTVEGATFIDFGILNAGPGGSDTVTSLETNNDWVVGANSVTLLGGTALVNVETLNAGSGVDAIMSAAAANTWNIGATSVMLGGSIVEINDAEVIDGGTGIDTFNIGGDFGVLNGDGGAGTGDADIFNLTSADFAGVANGEIGADVFNVDINTSATSTLNGGAGGDLFDFSVATSNVVVDGGNNTDTADYADVVGAILVNLDSASNLEVLTGNGDAAATLNSGSGNDAWVFNAGGTTGTIDTTIAFSGFSVLNAGTGTDTVASTEAANAWTIGANSASLDGGTTVLSQVETVNGGSGVDTFDISGNFGTLNGLGGNDVFTFTAPSNASIAGGADTDTADYGGAGAVSINLDSVDDLEILIGNGAATLNSGAQADAWVFDATGIAGTIDEDNDGLDLISFSAFGILSAGGGSDTVASTETANTWDITGAGVRVAGGTFISGADIVNGGTGIDTFNIGGDFGILNGDGGAGTGSADVFNLTGADFAGVANGEIGFDVFNIDVNTSATSTLNGNGGNDLFDFSVATSNVVVDGGNNTDTADYADVVGAILVNLDSSSNLEVLTGNGDAAATLNSGSGNDAWVFNAGGTTGTIDTTISFSGFSVLNAGTGTDTVASTEAANAWTIGANSASLDGGTTVLSQVETVNGGSGVDTFAISGNFGTLNGLGGNDVFTFTAPSNASIAGGADTDTADYGGAGAVSINLDSVDDLEILIGNGAATLNSGAQADAWVFDATGIAGTIDEDNDGLDLISFSAFGILSAGGGSDTVASTETANTWDITGAGVRVAGGTFISGADIVNGGTGIDTFNIGGDFGILNGDGGAGTGSADVFNLTGADFAGVANGEIGFDVFNIDVNTSATSTLNGDGGNDLFDFSVATSNVVVDGGNNTDTADYADVVGAILVNLDSSSNLEVLTGNGDAAATLNSGSGNDAWVFNAGGTTGTIDTTISFSGFSVLNAGTGTDTVASTEAANAWTIGANSASLDGGTTVLSQVETVNGGSGGDTFDISGNFGTLNGLGGNDVFTFTAPSNASIAGGADTDTADYGGAGAVTIDLDTVTDLEILIGNGAATLNSGADGDAWIVDATGSAGTVDPENDGIGSIIFSAFGNLNAGGGNDTLSSTETSNDWEVGAGGANLVGGTLLTNVETLNGGSGIDTFAINGNFGTLNGNGGNDIFTFATASNASLDGGLGDDTADYAAAGAVSVNLDSATNVETLNGNLLASLNSGIGDDAWVFDATGTAGTVDADSDGGATAFSNFGSLNAGAGDDTVASTETDNAWTIGANSASLDGGTTVLSQVETVNGSSGIDAFAVNGNFGVLNGNGGDDVFSVDAASNATMNGGDDSDTFIFNVTSSVAANGEGGDDIFDYRGAFTLLSLSGGLGSDTSDYSMAGALTVDLASEPGDIEIYTGNVDATLTSGSGADAWVFDALGTSGTANGTIFSAFGMLDAGAGTDTVTSAVAANNWVISATGDVSLAGGTELMAVEEVNGGSGIDVFAIGGDFAGTINGADGDDVFNISADTVAILNGMSGADAFNVLVASAATLNGGADIDTFTLDADLSGTASGGLGNDVFDVNSDVSGPLNGDEGSDTFNVLVASNATLNGGADDDAFNLNADLSGSANGDAGADSFVAAAGITASIDGGDDSDSLAGPDAINIWVVDSQDAGRLNDTVAFTAVENLQGGSAADTFTLSADVTVGVFGGDGNDIFDVMSDFFGAIDGEGDMDTFNLGASVASAAGGDGDDLFNVDAGVASALLSGDAGSDELIVANVGQSDQVLGFDGGADDDTITLAGAATDGTVDLASGDLTYSGGAGDFSASFTDLENIADTVDATALTVAIAGPVAVSIGAGTVVANDALVLDVDGFANIDFGNKTDFVLEAGAAVLTVATDVSIAGMFDLMAATVDNSSASTITADSLAVRDANVVGTLMTDVNALSVEDAQGAVAVSEVDDISITLARIGGTGSSLDLTAGGAVQIDGDIEADALGIVGSTTIGQADGTVINAASVTTQSVGGTSLTSAQNQIGALTVSNSGSGDVIVTNATALEIASVANAAGSVDIGSSESITQSGDITASDDVLVSGNSIAMSAGSSSASSAGDIGYLSVGSMAITSLDAAGLVGITAGGAFSQSGVVSAATGIMVNGAGVTMSSGSSSSTTGGDIEYSSDNGMTLTNLNAAGSVDVTAAGAVAQNGAIDATQDIDVRGGSVAMSGSASSSSTGGNLNYTTTGAMTVANLSAANSVDVVAGGAFVQTGAVAATQDTNVAGDSINMMTGSVASSTSGDVNYVADTDATISTLSVGTAGATVTVQATNGNIARVLTGDSGITANFIRLIAPGTLGDIGAAIAIDSFDGTTGDLFIDSTGVGGLYAGPPSFIQESGTLFTKTGNRAETTIDVSFSVAASVFGQSQGSALSDASAADSSVFDQELQIFDTIGSGVMLPCGQQEDEEAACE